MTEVNAFSFLNITEELAGILPCCAAFFNGEGVLLGCTDQTRTRLALQIIRQCIAAGGDRRETAASYSCAYDEIRDDQGELVCHVLLLDAAGREELLGSVRGVIKLSMELQEVQKQIYPEQKDHLSFVYELLSAKNGAREDLRARALRRRYILECPRSAVLFQIAPDISSDRSVYEDFSADEVRRAFSELISGFLSAEDGDLGDFINTYSYVLLKHIPEERGKARREFLESKLQYIIRTMRAVTGLRLRVCIGSGYFDLMEMHRSYEEAMFLSRHYDFLSPGRSEILFIGEYVYDYLISLAAQDYYSEKYRRFLQQLEKEPSLNATLISLSSHNMSMQQTASALGIHRNTVEKRYEKLRDVLGIHPAGLDRDRIAVRQYVIGCRKKRFLHGGGIIQNNNVYNTIYRKLAERLAVNSGGEMVLDFHTVGFSGNNRLLFEYLRQGEFDVCVGHVDALVPYLGEQISIVNAPFLFDDSDQAITILNGPYLQDFMGPLYEQGNFVPLAIWSMGWRYFSSAEGHPVRRPADIRGQRVRIMNKPLIADYIRYLGAVSLDLPYNRISSAFMEGIIDMQENPYRNFHEMHFHEFQKYILEMDMLFDSNIVLTTPKFMNGLTETERDIFRKSMAEAVDFNRDYFLTVTADCRPKILENGIVINRPDAEEEQEWRDAGNAFIRSSEYYGSFQRIEAYKQALKREKEGMR